MQKGTCSHQDGGCGAPGLAQVTPGDRRQQQGVPTQGWVCLASQPVTPPQGDCPAAVTRGSGTGCACRGAGFAS